MYLLTARNPTLGCALVSVDGPHTVPTESAAAPGANATSERRIFCRAFDIASGAHRVRIRGDFHDLALLCCDRAVGAGGVGGADDTQGSSLAYRGTAVMTTPCP